MTTKLSIIIPILNEKKNIIKLINEIKRKLTFINYEVIFVDDNSTDGSIDILKKIKFIDKKFNYITNTGPRDLTQSCFKGIRAAKSDLIVIMDGDLQHNPSYIKFLYRKIIDDKSDLVIASRDFKKTNTKTLSLVRITFSRVLIFLLKIISGKNYVDPMSGYFIFKKKIFDYLDHDQTILEREPLSKLAKENNLMCYKHTGFWHPMDTLKDKRTLDKLWKNNKAPWKKLIK